MFGLIIVSIAIFSILFLTGYTLFLSSPEYLDDYVYFSIFLLVSISLLGIHFYLKFKKEVKNRIEKNKKEIKLLKQKEIKGHILKKLENRDISITEIEDVISILKIGKLEKSKLENEIIKDYQSILIKFHENLKAKMGF